MHRVNEQGGSASQEQREKVVKCEVLSTMTESLFKYVFESYYVSPFPLTSCLNIGINGGSVPPLQVCASSLF